MEVIGGDLVGRNAGLEDVHGGGIEVREDVGVVKEVVDVYKRLRLPKKRKHRRLKGQTAAG